MGIFLVDYENVCSTYGLKGMEYLQASDELHIFYSQSCRKLRKEYMTAIELSSCAFHVYKLKAAGKNALDFYIAAQTGESFGNPEVTEIAIISKDKGFQAVADFWKIKDTSGKHRIILADSIEAAILKMTTEENLQRRQELQDKTQMLDIEAEYARQQEKRRIRSVIDEAFRGTVYQSKIDEVLRLIDEKQPQPGKTLYMESLHKFGRKAGCEIYRILKAV